MATVETLDINREQAAHKQHANAVDRFKKLELEAKATFNELISAQKRMREIGIVADVEMGPAMAAAYLEHKVSLTQNA